MTLIDTHIWVWWENRDPRLDQRSVAYLEAEYERGEVVVSAFSVWEIANLSSLGRLVLSPSLDAWMDRATHQPGLRVEPLTAEVALQANSLPDDFHRDPADQIIVATALVVGCPIMTVDSKILAYPHVEKVVLPEVTEKGEEDLADGQES